MAQWVKVAPLLLQWFGSLLWCGFDPRLGNFHMLQPKKKSFSGHTDDQKSLQKPSPWSPTYIHRSTHADTPPRRTKVRPGSASFRPTALSCPVSYQFLPWFPGQHSPASCSVEWSPGARNAHWAGNQDVSSFSGSATDPE